LGVLEYSFDVKGNENKLWMEATSRQFMIYISNEQSSYSLNDEGLVHTLKQEKK